MYTANWQEVLQQKELPVLENILHITFINSLLSESRNTTLETVVIVDTVLWESYSNIRIPVCFTNKQPQKDQ
jgi:hypothetical protein